MSRDLGTIERDFVLSQMAKVNQRPSWGMKCWSVLDLAVGLLRSATVECSARLAYVALGIDALVPVGAMDPPARSIEQGFELADNLSFALATTVTEALAVVPDLPGLMEVAPKKGEVGSQSSRWTAGSHPPGSHLLVVSQIGSAIFSKM
jgi:hypothetical protein